MAAVIQLPAHPTTHLAAPVAEFFALAQPIPEVGPEPRPQLRVIEGGRDAALRVRRPAEVYRRRRLAVTLLATLVLLVAATYGRSALAPETSPMSARAETVEASDAVAVPTGAAAAPALVHVVQPGETLWSIAESIVGDGDIRVVVDQLADAAGSPTLQAGQRLDLTGVTGG